MAKAKKSARKTSRAAAPRRVSPRSSSSVSINHSHPMYGYIAVAVIVVVLLYLGQYLF